MRKGKGGQNFERRTFTGLWTEKREGARVITVSDVKACNSRERPEPWIIYQRELGWECIDTGYHVLFTMAVFPKLDREFNEKIDQEDNAATP